MKKEQSYTDMLKRQRSYVYGELMFSRIEDGAGLWLSLHQMAQDIRKLNKRTAEREARLIEFHAKVCLIWGLVDKKRRLNLFKSRCLERHIPLLRTPPSFKEIQGMDLAILRDPPWS